MENLIDGVIEPVCDIDVEMAILSLCMRKNNAMMEVVQSKITDEDFTDSRNSTIYSVILDMYFDETEIDRFTVISELERRGLVEKAGGQRYVYHVGDLVAANSAIHSYINAIRERNEKRKILKILDNVRKETLGGKYRSSEVVKYAIGELSKLNSFGEAKDLVVLSEVLKLTLSSITDEIREANSGAKIKLGFPRLDLMMGGLGPGTLHILAARPGMGKTALAVNMAVNVAANQNPVVIFSLEMTMEEIGKRIMSSAMTKSVSSIINSRQITDSDWKQLDQAMVKLRDYPIYFGDTADIDPMTMKAKIQQLISSGVRPKLIFVDYIQLIEMKSMGNRSRNDEVAKISRNLKLLAKELRIPIIALSQLSRDSAKRNDHTPQISDLRDSGAIEQDADTVMFVDRPDYYHKKDGPAAYEENARPDTKQDSGSEASPAFIYLAKNRHGPVGKDQVWWIPSKTLFYEYTGNTPEEPVMSYDKVPEPDDEPVMDPPLSEDEGAQQEDSFFADAHEEYPEGLA